MSGQADIVKKDNLKLKVVRSKTAGAAALQGPKVFKEFWFVFRALIGGGKILEYHQSEKKYQESAAYPKGVLHLEAALAVSYHNPEKKQQFSIELAGGSFIFLESSSEAVAREWMTCLNAVLFGKGNGPNGALQYFVEVPVGSRLQYAGRSLLEVRDEELMIKTSDGTANLVRWKLAHIRSFKAKKDTLTVFSGSRSSTGVGNYVFQTPQSVQITHAIETVVRKLKYEALGSNQQELIPQHSMHHSVSAPGLVRARPFTSERRRPLPPPPPPSHPAPSPSITPPPTPSSGEISVELSMTAVPDHIPTELITDSKDTAHSRNKKYIPPFRTPEYSSVETTPEYSAVESTPEYSAVESTGPEEAYQRLDHNVKPKQRSASPSLPGKGYSRLSHKNAPGLPPRNPSRSRSGSPSPTHHPPDEEYGRLDHGIPPVRAAGVEAGEYGKLDHGIGGQKRWSNIGPPGDEEYGRLDHGVSGPPPGGEGEYGKLDHTTGSDGQPATEREAQATLAVPGTRAKAPPPVPQPYKPRPGSPMPSLIHKLNEQVPEGPPANKEGEMYSEVAPCVPSVGVSEGYGRLNHSSSAHLPQTSGPAVGPAHPDYSRLGAIPGAPPVIDPYASLSDDHINTLTEALRKEEGEGGGDYNTLGVVAPPSSTQVDSLGYSKPWTSYTKILNSTPAPGHTTPQPTQNGIKTEPSKNGTERAAVGESEFETLYDKMEGSEGTPPPPPPHRRNLSRHSSSPPAAGVSPVGGARQGGRGRKPALLPKPHKH